MHTHAADPAEPVQRCLVPHVVVVPHCPLAVHACTSVPLTHSVAPGVHAPFDEPDDVEDPLPDDPLSGSPPLLDPPSVDPVSSAAEPPESTATSRLLTSSVADPESVVAASGGVVVNGEPPQPTTAKNKNVRVLIGSSALVDSAVRWRRCSPAHG